MFIRYLCLNLLQKLFFTGYSDVFAVYLSLSWLLYFLSPQTVSSALFSEHQLCFSFLLCTAIMKNNCGENQFTNNLGFIPEHQWNFFLYSNMMANIKDPQDSENGKESL